MDLDSLNPRERLETLSAYLDGELPDEAARDVTAWLERHPEALREVEHQRRLWSLLGRYPDEPVPEGFAKRVMAVVQPAAENDSAPAASTPHLKLSRRRVWAFSAAAAVLAAVGTALVMGSRSEPGTGTTPPASEVVATLDPDFMQHADLAQLATLSDEQFSVLLVEDPDALADGDAQGG